jgi:hypothetical protein
MIGSSCTGLVRTVRTTERLPAYHFAHLVHQVTPTLREQMHIQPTRYGDARVVEKGGAAEAHQGRNCCPNCCPLLFDPTDDRAPVGICGGCLATYGLVKRVVGEEGLEPPTPCV